MNPAVLRRLSETVSAGVRPSTFRRNAPPGSVTPGAAEAATVLADGLEEVGYQAEASRLRVLAWAWSNYRRAPTRSELRSLKGQVRAAISRMARALPPTESEEARRRRLFQYYRRQKLAPPDAFHLAKRAENIGRLVYFDDHDEDWVEAVFRQQDGSYDLEHAERTGQRWRVYRTDLDRETVPDWINAANVAQTFDISGPTALRRMWTSSDPRTRAEARSIVGRYYGWRNFDDYPITMTTRELRLRYRRNIPR